MANDQITFGAVSQHHLKTSRSAGQNLVLNQGDIAETGIHDELIENGRLYKELWDSQEKAAANQYALNR